MGTLYYLDDMTNHRRFELGKGGRSVISEGRTIAETLRESPTSVFYHLHLCWCANTFHEHDETKCDRYLTALGRKLITFLGSSGELSLHTDDDDEMPWCDWPIVDTRYYEKP